MSKALVCLFFAGQLSAQVIGTDSLALVALYDSTNGASWSDTWDLNTPVSTWYGVTVDSERVVILDLHRNNLNGVIPTEIGDLTALHWLSLDRNSIVGTIPQEIGNLTSLAHLRLNENQLTGAIPTEIGNLLSLRTLRLEYNQLTGSIPDEIGNLINIWGSLDLSHNQLSGPIPTTLGNLTDMELLYLNDNQLSGPIPPEICSLPRLYHLDLAHNQLSGPIPTEIGNLPWLMGLVLRNNQITGTIPSEIGNLSMLSRLDLDSNQVTGPLPPEIVNCTELNGLFLKSNLFSGPLPSEIFQLTKLSHLNLSDNQFAGIIPTDIGSLPGLFMLYLNNNQLTGSIPDEISNLSNLHWLDLSNNPLTGTIPGDWSQLTGLTRLNLSNNQLTGAVPPGITGAHGFHWIYIHMNQLEDLPDLSPLNSLTKLHIQDNRFTFEDIEMNMGVASEEFVYTPQDSVGLEQFLYVHDGMKDFTHKVSVGGTANQYQWMKDDGDIPGAIEPRYSIPAVALSDTGAYVCRITNAIATELTLHSRPMHLAVMEPSMELDSLTLAHLYHSTGGPDWSNNANWLTGPIASWESVDISDGRIYNLDLANRNLSGPLPATIGNLTWMTYLNFSENQLTGEIPAAITNLTGMAELNLGHNQLTGPIPVGLGELTETLTVIHLEDNRLCGSVPSDIANMDSLFWLDVSDNDLTDFPDLSSVPQLHYLYLENNRFTFEDIEPNIGVPLEEFIYHPQDSVGIERDTTVTAGDTLDIVISIGGTANQYQWMLNGGDISGANDSTYSFTARGDIDEGAYICRATNTIATDLIIYSRPVHLTVEGELAISDEASWPDAYALHPAYPNPFNPVSTVRYDLPQASTVSLAVHDILGREVVRLVESYMEPGYHYAQWNGRDQLGRSVPSGIYIARLVTTEYSKSIKMVLLK
ncbi:MAG: T9SS type A sorting domain-containing protein [Fidelibacterota bacterium]|nr:MAG: T9SS type A sorting domain-containing protein [Candidatus Neomarinimicrobiota bacterium]